MTAELDLLRELESADEKIAAALAELDELAAQAEEARTRAAQLVDFNGRLPVERMRLQAAAADAERERAEAADALARAREEQAAAEQKGDVERLAAAGRFEQRAHDVLRMAQRRLEAAQAEEDELEQNAEQSAREAVDVEAKAQLLASLLTNSPRVADEAGVGPRGGLADVAEWGTRARAALLVARGGLAREREAIVRQANEVGALVLGEALTATSASGVTRRVERTLGVG